MLLESNSTFTNGEVKEVKLESHGRNSIPRKRPRTHPDGSRNCYPLVQETQATPCVRLYRGRFPGLSPHALHHVSDRRQRHSDLGRHRRHLHPVLARTRFLVQEDCEDGSIAHHLHRRHRVLYDDAGHQRGSWIRMEQDGLHLPRRHACHEFHHHHL